MSRTCIECGEPLPDGAHRLRQTCPGWCATARHRRQDADRRAANKPAPTGNRVDRRTPNPEPKPPAGRPRGKPTITAFAEATTYTDDEAEFLKRVADYKKRTGRQFPTNCELFGVVLEMGYRRGTV